MVSKILFASVALIHALPLLGLLGADGFRRAYGIAVSDVNTWVLLTHRAILFGILALLCVLAIFYERFRLPALICLSLSTLSFLILGLIGQSGRTLSFEMWRVMGFDLLAIGLLALLWCCHRKEL